MDSLSLVSFAPVPILGLLDYGKAYDRIWIPLVHGQSYMGVFSFWALENHGKGDEGAGHWVVCLSCADSKGNGDLG
jgi:hypothetical protein